MTAIAKQTNRQTFSELYMYYWIREERARRAREEKESEREKRERKVPKTQISLDS